MGDGGFSNPITGGGGALVRPSIHSPNYAAGSLGWSINVDGSAEFNSLSLRGAEVLGNPATFHIVLDGTTGTILVYDSTGRLVEQIGGSQGQIQCIGTDSSKIILNPSGAPPEIDFVDAGGTNTSKITQEVVSLGNIRLHIANVTNLFVDGGGIILNSTAKSFDPVAGYPTVETWHTLSLSAGWTGTLKYRLVPSPANCIQLQSTVMTPSTKADGTVIGTLPAGWRPSQNFDVLGTANATVGGGQTPHFNVNTNGQISCWGYTAATSAGLFALIPMDF